MADIGAYSAMTGCAGIDAPLPLHPPSRGPTLLDLLKAVWSSVRIHHSLGVEAASKAGWVAA